MPLTFRKSFQILPGVRLNINRRSWSVTTGGRHGPKRTHSSTGRLHDVDGPARSLRLAEDDQAQPPRLIHLVGVTPHAGSRAGA